MRHLILGDIHANLEALQAVIDDATMESTVIDNKLGNLLGVLGWDIKSTESNNTFNNLFDFGG